MSSQRFSYTPHPQFPVGIPLLNLQLTHNATAVTVMAVVDSGAALNILPYDVGKSLNLDWDSQTYPLDLGGILVGTPAYAVLLQAELTDFPPVKLAFAWISKPSTEVRVLLGQVNFFQEFDVHFYGSQKAFEIALKTA
ncbi:MAG TPA: retroviral-like aspartic protease [Chloroflexota bacterium]|nr:retroviral-like aspartic protease [Chloroflexota bacterium]HUM68171.1 retroviral-like aspartic protease [Chloroflexota bacterium]